MMVRVRRRLHARPCPRLPQSTTRLLEYTWWKVRGHAKQQPKYTRGELTYSVANHKIANKELRSEGRTEWNQCAHRMS